MSPLPAARLVDGFGRIATDLRVSLTDRCTLRCTYCMPAEGLDWTPRSELLTDGELVRLIRIAVGLGVREVRLTGGEPLLRPGLAGLVARVRAACPDLALSLTTNGLRLAELAPALAAAGLARVNVSLDTLRPDRFRALTRRDGLEDVLAGMAAAAAAGFAPVKVNTVLVRDSNDDEAPDLLDYCLARGYQLRFIEFMPLDAGHTWSRPDLVTAAEILARLGQRWTLTPTAEQRGSAPAETWLVDGGPATVGVIGSVTRPFCGACDRVRLTADGQIRNCLFARSETDVRTALRGGADDEAIAALWVAAVAGKAAGHGIDDPDFRQPDRPMSAIGG
ncbi:MAG TPA: GTP 3',8-cyclase MoaA [Mycobacteriales bacterium]|nr:GTP 3',8-cyclase MoaA [Mycobacteriales bacterium]